MVTWLCCFEACGEHSIMIRNIMMKEGGSHHCRQEAERKEGRAVGKYTFQMHALVTSFLGGH